MEFKSDSVSADLFYDRIAVFPGMSVDACAISPRCPHGFAAASPRLTHSSVTRTIFSALSETVPSLNIREASEK